MADTIRVQRSATLHERLAGRHNLPLIAGIVAVLAWGLGPLFVKSMSITATSVVFYRLLIGTAMMVAMARVTGGTIDRVALKRTFVPGVVFGISMVFGFASFKATSIANATIIGALTPVAVLAVSAAVYKIRPSGHQLAGAVAGLTGVAIVVLGANASSDAAFIGDLYAAINLAMWIFYLFATKRVRGEGMHTGTYIASIFVWATIVVIPWALLTADDLGEITGRDILLILAMALVPGLVGHTLNSWAQRDLSVSTISLLGLGNPVIAAIGAWLVYDQSLTALQVVGAVLVMGGLVAVVIEQRAIVEPEPV